jgi:outer membrane immunogenic protein
MKTFLAFTVGIFISTYFAHSSLAGPERIEAKDMKTVVQPVVEEHCNWTGFYIGAHVGYGWGDLAWIDSDTSLAPDPGADTGGPETLMNQSQGGVIAGGQLGYNRQFGHFVLGAEGEFSYSDVSESSSTGVIPGDISKDHFETNHDWLGTIGLRVGFACHHFLFFAKGGAAFTHQEYSLDHTLLLAGTVDRFRADETRACPMVGGGVEYAFTCHWSAKIEYSHLFLGAESIDGTNVEVGTGAEPESYQIDTNQDTVRVGLNYKF